MELEKKTIHFYKKIYMLYGKTFNYWDVVNGVYGEELYHVLGSMTYLHSNGYFYIKPQYTYETIEKLSIIFTDEFIEILENA